MDDIKTTLAAVIMGIASLLSGFDIIIPQDWLSAIIAIGAVMIGLLARDGKAVRPWVEKTEYRVK